MERGGFGAPDATHLDRSLLRLLSPAAFDPGEVGTRDSSPATTTTTTMGSDAPSAPPRPLSLSLCFILALSAAYGCSPVTACGSAYQNAIEDFCLTRFRLDMEGLDRHHWCSWEDTVETYGDLTNCTYMIALKMHCFWPNRLVDEFFIDIHRHYFHNCALSGRLLQDPPNRILGPFIVVPILVTLLMTALVVWRSKRSEGIV